MGELLAADGVTTRPAADFAKDIPKSPAKVWLCPALPQSDPRFRSALGARCSAALLEGEPDLASVTRRGAGYAYDQNWPNPYAYMESLPPVAKFAGPPPGSHAGDAELAGLRRLHYLRFGGGHQSAFRTGENINSLCGHVTGKGNTWSVWVGRFPPLSLLLDRACGIIPEGMVMVKMQLVSLASRLLVS